MAIDRVECPPLRLFGHFASNVFPIGMNWSDSDNCDRNDIRIGRIILQIRLRIAAADFLPRCR